MKRRAKAITDKMRLTYLFERSGEVSFRGKYRVTFQDLRGLTSQTYRQAIDAAIRQQKRGGRK